MSKVKLSPQYVTKRGRVMHTLPLSEYDSNHDYLTDYNLIQEEFNHVLGEVLTVIDASVIGQQNKAIKDIIKSIFIQEFIKLTEILHSKESIEEMSTLTDEQFEVIEEVSVDEIFKK